MSHMSIESFDSKKIVKGNKFIKVLLTKKEHFRLRVHTLIGYFNFELT